MFLNDLNLLERKSPIYPWEIIDAEGDIRRYKCTESKQNQKFSRNTNRRNQPTKFNLIAMQ